MKKVYKYFIGVFIFISLCFYLSNVFFSSEFVQNQIKEQKEKYYLLVDNCGGDEECWDKLWDDFILTMKKDMKDGLLDENYEYGWDLPKNIGYRDMLTKVKKITDVKKKYRIYKSFLTKLSELEKGERDVVISHLSTPQTSIYFTTDNWNVKGKQTLRDDYKRRKSIK